MKGQACIRIDFIPYSNIKKAIEEAKELAKLLKLAYVVFEFNDKNFRIGQHADVKEALDAYNSGVSDIFFS